MFDRAFFAYGAWAACDYDFSADRDLGGVKGEDIERRARAAGNRVAGMVGIAVEKDHPGNPNNPTAVLRLLALRAEADAKRGGDASLLTGCEAMRPAVRDVLLEILRFPASQ